MYYLAKILITNCINRLGSPMYNSNTIEIYISSKRSTDDKMAFVMRNPGASWLSVSLHQQMISIPWYSKMAAVGQGGGLPNRISLLKNFPRNCTFVLWLPLTSYRNFRENWELQLIEPIVANNKIKDFVVRRRGRTVTRYAVSPVITLWMRILQLPLFTKEESKAQRHHLAFKLCNQDFNAGLPNSKAAPFKSFVTYF